LEKSGGSRSGERKANSGLHHVSDKGKKREEQSEMVKMWGNFERGEKKKKGKSGLQGRKLKHSFREKRHNENETGNCNVLPKRQETKK